MKLNSGQKVAFGQNNLKLTLKTNLSLETNIVLINIGY